MNPFTRRTFLRSAPSVAAAVTLPVAVVATEAEKPETQEQKCVRLLNELLAEYRKLPMPGRSRYGDYVDLSIYFGGGHVRYGTEDGGHGEMLTVILSDEVDQLTKKESAHG